MPGRAQVQPPPQLGHLRRQRYEAHAYGALSPAPCFPICSCALSPACNAACTPQLIRRRRHTATRLPSCSPLPTCSPAPFTTYALCATLDRTREPSTSRSLAGTPPASRTCARCFPCQLSCAALPAPSPLMRTLVGRTAPPRCGPHTVCAPACATLGSTRTTSTSPSAGTRLASQTCARCFSCAAPCVPPNLQSRPVPSARCVHTPPHPSRPRPLPCSAYTARTPSACDPRQAAHAFNQPLSWDTSNITDMSQMFQARSPLCAVCTPICSYAVLRRI